jgi:O-antigen ligase
MKRALPASAWSLLLLMLAIPMLLPFSRSAELPLLAGAALGIGALARRQGDFCRSPAARALLLALTAYALAALLSAIDAVAPAKSWSTALASLRFLAFAAGMLALMEGALARGVEPRRLSIGLAWVGALPVALWSADALLQSATGHSLGGPLQADRLSGIFGADDLKLGPLLPTLAPLLLWPLLAGSRAVLALAWLALLLVVLLAGSRAGWISYGLVSGLLAWRLAQRSWPALLAWLALATFAAAAFAWFSYQASDTFRARVDRTLAAGSGQIDLALAGRVPIFATAGRMVLANPVNGVGVRSFRHAYPAYAAADDPWVDPVQNTGAAHAHQIVLELLTETGAIGLALWLAAAVLLWRTARAGGQPALAQAPWVALAVLVFPLNTHLAFYSSFLAIVLAWLVTLVCLGARLQGRLQAGAPMEGQQP